MFRKVIGQCEVPMIAFSFTIIGLINLTLCWPIPLGLYLSGTEVMPFESIFWVDLLIACILTLSKSLYLLTMDLVPLALSLTLIFHAFPYTVFHILTQFSSAVTYSMFVTLGLITSVPVSAGTFCHILFNIFRRDVILRSSNETFLLQMLSSQFRWIIWILFSFHLIWPALDIVLYHANFAGMKLAGVILISIGFFLVM